MQSVKVSDTVSDFFNTDLYCGAMNYEITSVVKASGETVDLAVYSSFISISETGLLEAASSDPTHKGDYVVTIRVTMAEFPAQSSETTFRMEIKFCTIDELIIP